jgi:hypothetical protein
VAKHVYGVCAHSGIQYKNTAQHKRKIKIVNAYGGECKCCHEHEIGFLSVNHKNNDGAEHKRLLGISGGSQFYCWIIKNNYPDCLELLCNNCNVSRGLYGVCHV